MRRGFEIWALVALLLSAWASWTIAPHAAAEDSKRVVVQSFRGPSGGVARNHVVGALKQQSDVEIYPSESFEGLSGAALQAAAAEAGVSAIIEGKVKKKGKLLQVNVSVRDASTDEVLRDADWTRKKNQLDDIRDKFWMVMGPYVMRTSVPAKPERQPEVVPVAPPPRPRVEQAEKPAPRVAATDSESAPEPEAEPTPDKSEKNPFHPALSVMFGWRLMWRKLAFDSGTTLNGYSSYASDEGSPSAFNLALDAQWFPAAHWRSDWVSDLGVEVDGDVAIGLNSRQGPGGKKYKTNAYEIAGGLVYRLPFEIFEPRFRASYVLQDFNPQTPLALATPAVKYSALRFGVGTLIKLVDVFTIDVSFGYLYVLDTGEIGTATFAKDATAWGWEVGGGAMVRIKQVFGIRLAADFRRYSLNMHGSENSRFILPKKASDDYLRTTLSFVYMLPGAK